MKNKALIEEKKLGEGVDGLVHNDQKNGTTILMFSDWKNDWKHWDCLVHEVTHLVHFVLGNMKNMMHEDEGRAYQTEFLFREIRRNLWQKTAKNNK